MAKSNEEYLEDLHKLWSNFMHEENDEKKEHWINLFMFTYHQISPETLKTESFLKDVPPKLCSYMLKLVYGIISEAIKTDLLENDKRGMENVETSDKHLLIAQLLENKFRSGDNISGLSQLTVEAPSDITAIISLRRFLTNGLGSHLLDFLSICDTRTIASNRNLMILLINLFPNTPWDKIDNNYYHAKEPITVDEFMDSFNLLDVSCHRRLEEIFPHLLTSLSTKCKTLTTENSSTENIENHIDIISVSYELLEFEKFKNKWKTSDEIAEILIGLLASFVKDENGRTLNENSATLESLKFSLDTLCNIQYSNAFEEQQRSVIQLKLLSLIALCLNNLFLRRTNILLIDLKRMFAKLFIYLQTFSEERQMNKYQIMAIYECIFMTFGSLLNMLVVFSNKFDLIEDTLNIFNEENVDAITSLINRLSTEQQYRHDEFSKKFVEILLIVINTIKCFEYRKMEQRIMKRKFKRKQLLPKSKQIHCQQSNLPCLFEKILLKILNTLTIQLQENVINHFRKNGLCCCAYTSNVVNLLFQSKYNTQMQKAVYNFIFNRILRTIFVKSGCVICETKMRTKDFHEKFFEFYKEKFLSISDPSEIRIFLKHLQKISHLLTFPILSSMLFDIILPIFYKEILKQKTERNLNVILECLNGIINYLNDARLIIMFFNNENLKYIKEILYIPELTRLACDLIRIGIEKASNSKDDEDCKRLNLSEKLIEMHLSVTQDINRKINEIFIIVKQRTNMLLISNEKAAYNHNNQENYLPYSSSLSINQLFYLASIFWNFTLELYKTNEHFRTCFQAQYQPTVSNLQINNEPDLRNITIDCALFQLVHDTLTSYLHQCPDPEQELTYHRCIFTSTSSNTFSDSTNAALPFCDGGKKFSKLKCEEEETIQDSVARLYTVNDFGECTLENINLPYTVHYRKRNKILTDDISSHASFVEIISKSYLNDDDSSMQSEFLEKLKSSDNNIIFDIKNQCNQFSSGSYYDIINQSEENKGNDILSSGLRTINWILSSSYSFLFGSDQKDRSQEKSPKLKSVDNEEVLLKQKEILQELQSVNCKKSLIRLFEFTLTVLIMEYSQDKGPLMSQSLSKIKEIILLYSKTENESNPSVIIQALQSLLKVAEIAQRPNISHRNKPSSIIIPHKELGEENVAINTSLDSDADYYSSKMSFSQLDSETEFSENETEECYITADEGYQADAELPEISEMNDDIQDVWYPYLPSSRYRSLIAHEGICKIIIEILIALSAKCIEDPGQWSSSLAQVANRLYVVRESLGGCLFLLKGFAPILKSNNSKLRDFQQSILDLLTDLNSPESLSAYLEILGSDNAPFDVLVRYMSHLCITNIRVQPSAEIVFPVKNDEFVKYSCNPIIFEQIKQLRNYHKFHNLETPFTETPLIIPLVHNKLWHEDGFTVSTWIHIKSFNVSTACDNNNTDLNEEDSNKIHLISVGSNQILLSIYINEELSLTFETTKPNEEIDHSKEIKTHTKSKITKESCSNQQSFCMLRRRKKCSKKINKPSLELPEEDTNKENILLNAETQSQATKEKMTNVLQCTKLAILNSISQFQLFSSSTRNSGDSFEKSSVDLSYFRLARKKWMHLCFSIDPQPKALNITMIVDGTRQYVISLPCNALHLANSDKFQVICVGQFSSKNFVTYSLSNLMLFHKCISNKSILANLTALGPDCTNLTYCQAGNNVPNYGLLNFSKTFNLKILNFGESIRHLKENLIACYSAHEPGYIVGFEKDTDGSTLGCINGLVMFGAELGPNIIPTVQTAVFLNGGLSCLLLLFAKAVETSSDPIIQALVLDILLSVARSNSDLYTEFVKKDYLDLIGYVIKTERCSKDVALLKSIINNACTQPVISKRNDLVQVMDNTIACIIHPNFIVNVIRRYSDWYRPGSKESPILDTLLSSIRALVREKHPLQNFNIHQLIQAGLLRELLNLCKVYIIESPTPVHISEYSAKSFVSILNTFAGSPPSPSLLDEIMKLLLLLQRPSECFITHDRSKFYFLINPDPPLKHKKISLPLPSKQMKQIMRERKRTAPAGIHTVESGRSTLIEKNESPKIRKHGLKNGNNVKKLMEMKAVNALQVDNFEDLKDIADCTKLTRNVLNLFSSRDSLKWRNSLTSKRKIGLSGLQHHRDRIGKINRKRIRSTSKSNTDSDVEKKRKFILDAHPLGEKEYITSGEYDIIHSDEVFDLDGPKRTSVRKYKFISKRDFYELPGIIKIQEGLFHLLRNFLLILPDTSVAEVSTHYIKIEILLVLSNHKNCGVRGSLVKLLATLCDRLPTSELQTFSKKFYWHHLANQLSLNPVDANLLEACMQWITGTYNTLDEYLLQKNLVVTKKYGLNVLIAFLPQTLSNPNLVANAFQIVTNLFKGDNSVRAYFLDNGLIQTSIKTLYRLYMKLKPISNYVEKTITDLLLAISEKSVKSHGQINVLWDLLNLLSVNQESDILSLMKGFRSVQANILLNTLELFLPKNVSATSPAKYKNMQLSDSYLSLSESKTRFELLIDRSAQLLVSSELSYKPTTPEIKLFEFLVLFGFSGNMKCSSLIIWGLLPCRPTEIKAFIIDSLWNLCRSDIIPHPILCDMKIIRSLLALHLFEEHQEESNTKLMSTLFKLCKRLSITKSSLRAEIDPDKYDLNREHCLVKLKSAVEKSLYKYESLAQSCIDSSMVITRIVTELQNAERKVLMNQMKEYDANYIYNEWISVIQRMTHEGAPWFNKKNYPKSWELDDTEGPSRVRVRLRRCHLHLESRFIMAESPETDNKTMKPFEYLLTGHDHYLSFSKNAQVLYNFPAVYLPVDGEIDGELLITDEKLYFVATYRYKFYYLSYDIKTITEIWLRRYQHQEKAFEIFLESNKSKFFALKSVEDFRAIKEIFTDKIVQLPDQNKLLLITQQWRDGQLTNWEYIITLNQISGRTYNDLMQYPVFPWILSNFNSERLDLRNPKNFRKLEKPIAVQHKENELHYINNYMYINNTMTNMGTLLLKPYHFSSHYSNSGTVLHFLVRVPPFTSYFLRYQDNNFDLPDRTFHSLNTTWRLASRDSPTDVKELIPEFFCLPEMFENFEGFNFGARQSGEVVDNVILPSWCLNNPRLFVFIHRQALESEIVRNNLHNWIDLIFGYKQTGCHAIEAINVFHPATYAEFHVSEVSDPIERKAIETMVKTYGQMPKQLLKVPHPGSKQPSQLPYNPCEFKVLSTVDGLRWGTFTGSPELSYPELNCRHMLNGITFSSLISFSQTNVVYGLPEKCCVMQGAEADIYLLISWNHEDRLVRFQPLSETNSRTKPLLFNNPLDEITCSGSDFNSNSLWFGHKSGRISVYQCYKSQKYHKSRHTSANIKLSYNSAFRIIPSKHTQKSEEHDSENDSNGVYECGSLRWLPPVILTRHQDEVTSIVLSSEFKIAVSVGRDGLGIIWDSNNFGYVRTIKKPTEILNLPISLVAISPTLGDIITVHGMETFGRNGSRDDECFEVTEDSFDGFVNVSMNLTGKSMMRLHSINGKYIERITSLEKIVSACYSYVKEGTGVNVIVTGFENGIIKFWSSWNLAYIREIHIKSDILSLTYSTYQHLIVLTRNNYIEVWQSDDLHGKPPMFPQITFNKINLS